MFPLHVLWVQKALPCDVQFTLHFPARQRIAHHRLTMADWQKGNHPLFIVDHQLSFGN
jgi:hypothetical protein